MQEEVRTAQVEAAAELARLERERRELVGRYERAEAALEGMAPRTALDAERAEKERYLRAYRSLAEQAARCAGSEADAVRHELQASMLSQQLRITEAALATATQAADDRAQALEQLAARAESRAEGGGGLGSTLNSTARSDRSDNRSDTRSDTRSDKGMSASARSGRGAARDARDSTQPDAFALEAKVQSLTISEAAALSRAEAAEKVLEDAMVERRKLAERLERVEAPVAELTESSRAAHEELDNAVAELATLKVGLATAGSVVTSGAAASGAAAVGAAAVGAEADDEVGGARDGASREEDAFSGDAVVGAISAADELTKLRAEVKAAKEEALRAKEIEHIATLQVH